ncbi:hypothetical protein GF420_15660 [candidate division GN15 bacterium]|nr:hypothetical protein [candidate division GN15 bacterium]
MNDAEVGFICNLIEEYVDHDAQVQTDHRFDEVLNEYDEKVEEVLEKFVAKWPLAEEYTVQDLIDEGSASFNIYMTLEGHGVGIWDGRWDHFWDSQRVMDALMETIKDELREYVCDMEPGKLQNEFWRCLVSV